MSGINSHPDVDAAPASLATAQPHVPRVPVSIDNPDDWAELAEQIAAGPAMPTVLAPELVASTVGGAVPLLFAADEARNLDLLRGTFAEPVIAQWLGNLGCLTGAHPVRVGVQLVGAHLVETHPVVRLHLAVQTLDDEGNPAAQNQFWELESDGQVTAGQTTCPNCGAPLAPLVVSHLELY